jgi:flagellar export protein FliJ
LKRLVSYRERLERLQEHELARAMQTMAAREQALAEKQLLRREYLASTVSRGRIDPVELASGAAYHQRLERDIEARTAALQHSAGLVAEERVRVLERRRDRKAMEALLERRIAADRLEHNRAAVAAIDEAAITRWQAASD